jgi:phosphonate degradation associated HDIG domain protein
LDPIADIIETLSSLGEQRYGKENVSQLAHALQCATLAEEDGATSALITASLLHDMGHLVDKRFEVGQKSEIDRHHENIGAAYLSAWFPPDVTDPIRLHVPAKRYLCATEDGYFDDLSDASVRSLKLQGGAFDKAEADAFISQPHAKDAVRLRRWDDLAKVPDLATLSLEHFRTHIDQVFVSTRA